MQIHSPRNILAISAVVALGTAAMVPTGAFAAGQGPRSGACTGDCDNAGAAVQQAKRARDGSGAGAGAAVQQAKRARDGSGTGAQATLTTQAANQVRAGGAGKQSQAGMQFQKATQRAQDGAAQVEAANGAAQNGYGAGAGSGLGAGPAWSHESVSGPGVCEDCTYEMGTLSDADIEGLAYMANEEKLAQDVYLAFAEMYDVPAFERIAASEARHQLALDSIFERYGIENATSGQPAGTFDDAEFAALYATMVEQGSAGLDEALAVAIQIEQLDIADLEQRSGGLAETAPDVNAVYTHLANASANHLAAFERLS